MNWEKRDAFNTIEECVQRNVGDLDTFLHPKRDPYLFHLKEIVDFIQHCIKNHILINVVADYDADGVCSASILDLAIRKAGGKINMVIPRRFTEGYGFSERILSRLEKGNILTVDNGIAAAVTIEKAKQQGFECAVIDHHMAPDSGILPDCIILDPHVEEKSEYKEYCGAGLAYRVAKELISDETILEQCLIFASIATVADVMTLTGDNRNLVKDGLAAVNEGAGTRGFRMLLKVIRNFRMLDGVYSAQAINYLERPLDPFDEESYGFQIGPAINACGRLLDEGAMIPYRLFMMDFSVDEQTMFYEAFKIVSYNEKRKKKVDEQFQIALSLVEAEDVKHSICIYDSQFHPGIVGIIAGKLAELYHVPAIVLCPPYGQPDSDILKGSGRSSGDIHLKYLLDSLQEYLLGYGGHAGAAGLSMKKIHFAAFKEALEDALKDVSSGNGVSYYDLEIPVTAIPSLVNELELYAPFGEGNPKIIFKITGINPSVMPNGKRYAEIGSDHQHIKMKHEDRIGINLFFLADKFRKENEPTNIICYGSIGKNYFNGNMTPECYTDDFEVVEERKTDLFQNLESLMII